MVNAILLLNVQRDQINEVAERLAELDGIAEVYSVAGRFDLVAVVRAKDNETLADLVTRRYDLEHMFSVGMDEQP
jgi:DNA-binding Lrp family transcriptional regulator